MIIFFNYIIGKQLEVQRIDQWISNKLGLIRGCLTRWSCGSWQTLNLLSLKLEGPHIWVPSITLAAKGIGQQHCPYCIEIFILHIKLNMRNSAQLSTYKSFLCTPNTTQTASILIIKYQNLNSIRKSTHSPHFHCYRTDTSLYTNKYHLKWKLRPYDKNSVNQQPKNTEVYNHLFTATNINSVCDFLMKSCTWEQ